MTRPGLIILMRDRLVGVALALLAAGVIAPGAARAGCEHDPAAAPASADQFRLLRACGALGSTGEARQDAPSHGGERPRPGTCTSPSCSRRPGLPPAPGSLGVARAGHWALVEVRPPADRPVAMNRLADEADARPIRTASAIFHPPRLGAVAA